MLVDLVQPASIAIKRRRIEARAELVELERSLAESRQIRAAVTRHASALAALLPNLTLDGVTVAEREALGDELRSMARLGDLGELADPEAFERAAKAPR